jgi:calnexin
MFKQCAVAENPKCESAPGCGVWTAPTIKNPAYKGKWRAPKIDNPAYKGKWKATVIDNPHYFEANAYEMSSIVSTRATLNIPPIVL